MKNLCPPPIRRVPWLKSSNDCTLKKKKKIKEPREFIYSSFAGYQVAQVSLFLIVQLKSILISHPLSPLCLYWGCSQKLAHLLSSPPWDYRHASSYPADGDLNQEFCTCSTSTLHTDLHHRLKAGGLIYTVHSNHESVGLSAKWLSKHHLIYGLSENSVSMFYYDTQVNYLSKNKISSSSMASFLLRDKLRHIYVCPHTDDQLKLAKTQQETEHGKKLREKQHLMLAAHASRAELERWLRTCCLCR